MPARTILGNTPQGPQSYGSGMVTIANGTSLSSVIDIRGAKGGSIRMPAAWTAAAINFASAGDPDGTDATFLPVTDNGGTELTMTVAADKVVQIPQALFLAGVSFIKLRSGTSGAPVNQGAERTLCICLVG